MSRADVLDVLTILSAVGAVAVWAVTGSVETQAVGWALIALFQGL
ncbi:membrane protein [Arthrobacter phage MaGuCo]|uniref:Membrane protein n=1 Tax=Arthrobacter phage MaGuCo TaxID=3038363 RepID=A0AAF0GH08_9CAUD|nr:membrane protein [Arthrobacter phage MaGuCo]